MKKNYQKPTLQVVQLQQQTQLLSNTSPDVIAPGPPNATAGARGYRGHCDNDGWDIWDE